MKKLSFALACIIGLMFFASCKKDTQLTITPIKTQGYVTDGAQVNIGETIQFGFDAEGTDLDDFEYLITAGNHSEGEEIFLEKLTSYSYTGTYKAEIGGTVTITGTIKNVKGETATSTVTITVLEPENHKFIGNYAGTLKGNATIEIMGQTQEMDEIEYDAQLELLAGENDNEVKAHYVQEGTEYDVKGVCEGNVVTFEPITVTYSETGTDMEIVINLKGTLEGSYLLVEGTAETEGEIQMPQLPMPVPFVMHINVDGTLIKQ